MITKNIKRTKTGKDAQLQISFAWIFAIIVGAVILFLAIYISTKAVKTGESAISAKTGKEVSVLLNPLETGFESGEIVLLTMPVETRIYNNCSSGENLYGNFGRQIIKISQKNLGRWTETDAEAGLSNKYIFSEDFVEGRSFEIFAKPFEFPFKISDVIYHVPTGKKYCFLSAPERIKDEISDLNRENILVEDETCPSDSIKVCFTGSSDDDCDITVNEFQKSVEKRGEIVYYETDALMYAAVFSEKKVYECQVKRLMQREEQLSKIYGEKRVLLSTRQGCIDAINLGLLESVAGSLKSSQDLINVATISNQVNAQNNVASCRLW